VKGHVRSQVRVSPVTQLRLLLAQAFVEDGGRQATQQGVGPQGYSPGYFRGSAQMQQVAWALGATSGSGFHRCAQLLLTIGQRHGLQYRLAAFPQPVGVGHWYPAAQGRVGLGRSGIITYSCSPAKWGSCPLLV
jgi:hypothetical protein